MLPTFRTNLHRTFRKYRAVQILLNNPSPAELRRLDESLENIERMPGPELRRKARTFQTEYERFVKLYGVRGNIAEFEEILEDYAKAKKPILYVTRYDIERLFSRYESRFPDLGQLPPHGRIGIEVGGRRAAGTSANTFLLEASLFEDMAALWNAGLEATTAAAPATSTLQQNKHAAALRRATTKAAFNLLEGYLNGIAVDIQLTTDVSAKEKVLLQEWDDAKKRPVRLSLRDKILQYVKLASGSDHPPIQETSSKAMAVVLATEGAVRHALIHPTPRLLPRDETYRENVYLNLDLPEVKAVCDAVVDLIREIRAAIGPKFGEVDWWLFQRDANDRYPEAVFV